MEMEIAGQPKTTIQIPCCLCGTLITPNPANQCGTCLAQQFDLKASKQLRDRKREINQQKE
jgi:NMD protein affecting ribosome stability and mRNA decay